MSRTVKAQDIIADALGLLGVLAAEEHARAEQQDLGFRILNDLVDSYVTQDLTMITTERHTFPITSSVNTYDIGPGATIDLPRPTVIESAGVILNFGTPTELEIPLSFLTDEGYANIRTKTLSSPLPTQIYYNPTVVTTGWGSILLYPTPTQAGLTAAIYLTTQNAQFSSLTADVVLAPGYARAYKYGLAMELLPYYSHDVDPTLAQNAAAALRDIKRTNVRVQDLALDPGLTMGSQQSWYNINTDTP